MMDTIDLEINLPTSLEVSWRLVTDPIHFKTWFGEHVSLDAKLGGEFREVWFQGGRQVVTTGRVEECDPPFAIAWTWRDDNWTAVTRLRLTFSAVAEGTRVRLVHFGWSNFPVAIGEQLRTAHAEGWRQHLENLRRYAIQQRNGR
jgi:uncharacterized protein YndB with AHSA1/START domain